MSAVAIETSRDGFGAQIMGTAVIALQVLPQAWHVAFATKFIAGQFEATRGPDDLVSGVAITANRRFLVTLSELSAMDAHRVLIERPAMAFPASFWDVQSVDSRTRVASSTDCVAVAVAVRARGRGE